METILCLVVLAFGVWAGIANLRRGLRGDDLSVLPKVDAQFRGLIVPGATPESTFDGSLAEIVHEEFETMSNSEAGTTDLLRVQRYARNPHGEYFFYISDGSAAPFLKHVPQHLARLVLKNKYRAPGAPPA